MKFVLITLATSIVLSNHSFADEEQNEAVRQATSKMDVTVRMGPPQSKESAGG